MMKTVIQRINNWRRERLFVTASENKKHVENAFNNGMTAANAVLHEMQVRTTNLWTDLQKIKLGIESRSQVLDIHLILDRKSLRLLDVEDAARLLAARTEQIYCEALKKRLAAEQRNIQPKEQNATDGSKSVQ